LPQGLDEHGEAEAPGRRQPGAAPGQEPAKDNAVQDVGEAVRVQQVLGVVRAPGVARPEDLIRIKEYVSFMLTYAEVRGDRQRFVALTGLTPPEFEPLVAAFARAYERLQPADRTAAGRPRRRR